MVTDRSMVRGEIADIVFDSPAAQVLDLLTDYALGLVKLAAAPATPLAVELCDSGRDDAPSLPARTEDPYTWRCAVCDTPVLSAEEQVAADNARDLDLLTSIVTTQGKKAGKEAVDEINARRHASMIQHPSNQEPT